MGKLKVIWLWLRFYPIKKKVTCYIDYRECEAEFYSRQGEVVGVWAYGYYDPHMPYQGQECLLYKIKPPKKTICKLCGKKGCIDPDCIPW